MRINRAEIFQEVKCLAGERTILRTLALDMAQELFAATEESRDKLHKFVPWENKTVNDARDFIELSIKQRKEGSAFNMSIHEREREQIAGTIGIHKFDSFTPLCEVGYWIRSSMNGKGYATDALSTLLKFCAEKLELVRVDARAATENTASQRVLAKCGFREEGLKKKAELCHGVWHDLKLFGKILKD